MKAAGRFTEAVEWMPRHSYRDETGQIVEFEDDLSSSSSSPILLWAEVETVSGSVETDYGAPRGQGSAVITFRQILPIDQKDRIKHLRYDEIYVVDGVRRSGPETILDCHKYDSTELNDI